MKRVTIVFCAFLITACASRPVGTTTPTISSSDPAPAPVEHEAMVIRHDTLERFHFQRGEYEHHANGCASSRSTDMVDQLVKHGFTVEMIDGSSLATIRPIVELINPDLPDTEDNVRYVGEKRSDAKEVYGTMGKWLTVARGVSITFIVNVDRYGAALNSAGSEFAAIAKVSMIQRYHGEECTVAWTSYDGTRL